MIARSSEVPFLDRYIPGGVKERGWSLSQPRMAEARTRGGPWGGPVPQGYLDGALKVFWHLHHLPEHLLWLSIWGLELRTLYLSA